MQYNAPLMWCKQHLARRQFLVLLSFIIGLLASMAAYMLKRLIFFIEHFLTHGFDITSGNWLYLVYPVVGILLSALFIRYIVRDDIGHGVTKILHSLSRSQGFLRSHNTWTSVVASGLTIGFGGSVGAESPMVLTGSAIGSTLGRWCGMDRKAVMTLIGCGAAGAIAGIFKAPIAGLVFTIEVLMIDITMVSLVPLLISCATATCLSYFLSGSDSMFHFQLRDQFVVSRVPSSILLGIFCGFISLYFTRVTGAFEYVFTKIGGMYRRMALGGSVIALLIYLFPPLYGEGYTTISALLSSTSGEEAARVMNNSLFYGHSEWLIVYLLLIILVKVFATTATNGGGGCGGTFAPSLFLGCIGGFAFASLWNTWVPATTVPLTNYALLGMAGVMSGVFHAPLTGIFLTCELTGGYDLFVPLIIVSTVSYITIRAFEPHSIYAQRLARRGELLTHHKDRSVLSLLSLNALIDTKRPTLTPEMTLSQIIQVFGRSRDYHFAVVNKAGTFLGLITINHLREYIFRPELYREFTAGQLMCKPPAVLLSDAPMTDVLDTFDRVGSSTLPVVRADGSFLGFVSRDHVLGDYRETMKDFSEE